ELVLGLNGATAYGRYNTGSGAPISVQQSAALSTGEWHHLALRIGDGNLTLLVDGVDAGHAAATAQELGGTLNIGAAGAGGHFLSGELDELQVSNSARSTDWIKAAARSQGMVAPLVVYGGDSQKEGGGESYFVTTLRNVTVDGWVIIGILGVLFLA